MILGKLNGSSAIIKYLDQKSGGESTDVKSDKPEENVGLFGKIGKYLISMSEGQEKFNQAVKNGFDSKKVDLYAKALDGLSESQQKTIINTSKLEDDEKNELLSYIESLKNTEIPEVEIETKVDTDVDTEELSTIQEQVDNAQEQLDNVQEVIDGINGVETEDIEIDTDVGVNVEEAEEKLSEVEDTINEVREAMEEGTEATLEDNEATEEGIATNEAEALSNEVSATSEIADTAATDANIVSTEADTIATNANTGANVANTTSDIADTAANNANAASTVNDTVATDANTVATDANTGANAANAASDVASAGAKTTSSGLSMILAATGLSGITKSAKGIGSGVATLAKAHPVIAGIIAALAAAGVAFSMYQKKQKEAAEEIKKEHEDARQALEDSTNSLDDEKSKLESVNSELQTTKDKIKEIFAAGTPTLTDQNEITKLSAANAQLEIQQTLLENNIRLKQKEAALDAKKMLGTQTEADRSDVVVSYDSPTDYSEASVETESESGSYLELLEGQLDDMYKGYRLYISGLTEDNLSKQQIGKELIEATSTNSSKLTNEVSTILESFKNDDGTIMEGYEDIYNEYMGLIYNLQSLTSPDVFFKIAESVTAGTKVDYEKAIAQVYQLIYDGNFDIKSLNQDFVNALTEAGIDEKTISYMFRLKQQEYQLLIDKINEKYNPDNILTPTYIVRPDQANGDTTFEAQQKLEDKKKAESKKQEVKKINAVLNDYAKNNPIEFQLIYSYDENFDLLDEYIKEEKNKIKTELESLSKEGNIDLTIRPLVDSSAMRDAGWDVEDGYISTTFTQGEFIWQGDEENGQYVYVHYTPILPDGTVLTPDEITDYLYGTLESSQNILEADNKGIVLSVDTDLNIPENDIKNFQNGGASTEAIDGIIKKTGEWDDHVHNVQEQYYAIGNNVDYIENAIQRVYDEAKKVNSVNEGNLFVKTLNSSKYKKIKKELLELAKSGEITEETLQSTEEYIKLLDETKTSARSAKDQILDMLTTQEKLAGISRGLGSLSSAYEEFKDEDIGFVTAETLESLPDVFKKLPEFNLFSQIVGDPNSGADAIQKAFNDLATAYVNDQRLFSNITEASESEINSFIANLKHLGITNAEEVVNNTKKNAEGASHLINETETEYLNYLHNKDGYDKEYFNEVAKNNGVLISTFGEQYQTDYDNWCDLLTKKAEALNEFIDTINSSGMFGDTDSVLSGYSTRTDKEAYESAKRIVEEYDAYQKEIVATGTNRGASGFGFPDDIGNVWIYDSIANKDFDMDAINKSRAYVESYEKAQKAREILNLNLSKVSTDFNFDATANFKPDSDSGSDPEDYDWIEILLDNTSEELDKVKDKVDDTYSTWEERNKSLQKAITDTRNAMALQAQAKATYLAKAESIGLSGTYKTLVQNGEMWIQDNVDETTSKLISEYKEWWDKAKACKDAQDELNDSLKELETISKMDLVEGKYDALYSKLDNSIDTIQSKIDKAELKGMFANENYYSSMIGYTQSKINNLRKERAELSNIMNMSGVQNDTEAWSEMYQKLMDVDSEILTLENDIIGFNNDIRNLNWEIFEYLEESISRITDESQYLIDLIAHEDLFDKDTGKFTEYSDATLGLHAVNYDTYKQQAQDYYEEVQELQRQLVNGAGQEVLEQYNKMVDAHQDAVLAAEDEKQAMLDLIEEGYNAQLEAIQKIIDKKKEQINQEKDLYDYQKSIAEKTKNIASLEKQKLAYEGDDSEEGMSRIQQIKVELEEAKADLEQTEYEKYLDDSQRMLDELTQDYEDWMNERLDDEDALLKEIVSGISNKGDEINNTLQTVANENGTFISDTITSIFDANSPFTSELSSIKTNTAGTTNAINTLINKVVGITGAQTKGNAGGTSGSNGNSNGSSNASGGSNKTPSTPTTPSTPNNTNANKNASNNSSKGEYDGIFIYKKYSPQQLNTNTSLVDRLKSKNIDASWEARAKYWSKIFGGAYTGSESQNVKFLNWLKSNGYKSGTSSAKKGLHWTQENGEEFIIRKSDGAILTPLGNGDMVFDNEASRRLWELSQNPEKYLANMSMPQLSVGMPNYSGLAAKGNVSQTMEVRIDGISIELPGVTDYASFRSELIKDSTFEKAMCTMVNNIVMSKNPLEKMKYSRR